MGRASLAVVVAALVIPLCGCNTDASTPDTGPLGAYRRSYAQTEPSLATTPDTSASRDRRIWIAYNDLTEENAVLAGDPDFHNLEAISWSTDLGSSWHYKSLPYTSVDPDLSWTGGDPWLASDGPTLIYTAIGYRGGSPDALALTESIGNQQFSPWRIIARAPDVAADAPGGAGTATFDKPSVDLGTVPFGSGEFQIAAAASRLKRQLGPSKFRFDIALSTAFSVFSDHGAADRPWTTRLLGVGSPISMVTNPIVKISHEGTGNLFVAYQSQGFDESNPAADNGGRFWKIVRTTVSGTPPSLVFSRFAATNRSWHWTSGDSTRTVLDMMPMAFDIAPRPTGTHLWITYAEKAEVGDQHVVVADCDDTEDHRCTPEAGWHYKIFKGLHGGDLLQPSVAADRNNQGVSVTFYENRGEGTGLEPEGVLGGLDPDGNAEWAGVVSLALADPFANPQESSYLPCPYDNNRYGDYIGSVRLPIPSLTISAWADSRRGCVSPGNDLHVQATVW